MTSVLYTAANSVVDSILCHLLDVQDRLSLSKARPTHLLEALHEDAIQLFPQRLHRIRQAAYLYEQMDGTIPKTAVSAPGFVVSEDSLNPGQPERQCFCNS